ncbi:AraC family transcriptional regulator [Flavihumibacter sp. CACIAM 22H1]|uniref:AraC family transcriptional regulator n=1 Tax=Flavihumibacter sp. CACIAM 22H1 TaxID=1812911 RepID=UPI0007A8E3CD|nr:AraC family transcriptional regulator [Flavihumibacter sp. CACIAM 22H1]KYP16379.1 MAG: AraC family transcriptional regulator [Flavihumibacter sp. CACIAM 22H1]
MKVLQFTIPVPGEKNIIVQRDKMPYMYQHLHRHDELQLTWIIKGEGTLVVENNMHPFRSNEIYCIGANQPHVFKNNPVYYDGNLEVETLTVFFNPSGKLQHLFDLTETKQIRQFLHKHRSGFILPEEITADISALMLRMEQQNNIEQVISFLELLRHCCSATQLKELASVSEMAQFSENEGIRLGNIYNFILSNYAEQLTLDDVAKQAHMTPQAFCRFFKKRTRHTFVSFLNEVRINEACKKLTEGGFDSISTIAYTCGFNSITNFNRVFKSVLGKSPSEYVESYTLHTYEVAS